jgi:hypothetical protein
MFGGDRCNCFCLVAVHPVTGTCFSINGTIRQVVASCWVLCPVLRLWFFGVGWGVCFLFVVGVVLWVRSFSQSGLCTSGVVLIMEKKYVVPSQLNAMGENSILLVKDLLELLKGCDPDAHVLVDVQALGGNDSGDDFCNVGVVRLPDGDESHAVTLEVLAQSYDPRQF